MICRYHYTIASSAGLNEKFTSAEAGQLHKALCGNRKDEARALLESGVRPDENTLLTAVWKFKAEWVKLFMEHGVPPTRRALGYARHYRDPQVRDILLGAGLIPDEGEIKKVVEEGLTDWVRAYIAHGAQPTVEMLDIAARKNWDIETARALLEAGVVPEAKTLEFVVEYKRENFAKRLFADVKKPKTPKSDWINALVAAGAVPTSDMLATAYRNDDLHAGKALIAAGVVPDDTFVDTIMSRDLTWGWLETLATAKGKLPAQLLERAVVNHQPEAVSCLVNRGAVPDEALIKLAADKQDTHSTVLLQWAFNEHKAKQAKQPRKRLVLSKPPSSPPKLVHRLQR